ncbi:methyl-accepting chemotaxis protein [Vibrio salinus]|uniref:methyl-accepting chemotaxis protein n=1 Tax=Vibrio salinus TaxID=2899784 RepID=UPI001E430CD1|nr:methyl-accepting chemotaxis protein [Vibrio salinus]MCE0494772.1 methyl-accepting chemotaxis protein [Vibrio salinus]
MFDQFKIKTRVMAAISLLMILVSALTITMALTKSKNALWTAEMRELKVLYNIALARIESNGNLATGLAKVISLTPGIQRSFANRDRKSLAKLTVPMFKTLEQEYGVRQFQFHTPPATSFFRAHKPAKFGDDLTPFRKTVVKANQSKKTIMGLEKGIAGIGIRGIVPVNYQHNHLGSVEFGMSFDQTFFDQFKHTFGVDINLYTFNSGKINTFASTTGGVMLSNKADIQAVFDGREDYMQGKTELKGTPLATYLKVIPDYSGNPIAVIEIAMDRSHNLETEHGLIYETITGTIITLILGLIAAYFIARGITNPINRATEAMADIAHGDGDLTSRLNDRAKDEVGELARQFNYFVSKVHDTVVEANLVSQSLNSSAEKLSQVTEQTGNNIQRQQQETELVATAMNEMVATVQEVAQSASEAAEATEKANKASMHGQSDVESVINSINNLSEDIEQTGKVLKQLEQQSTDIDTVLEVIRSIAEQTNLLALNAAIEAARAGEQGRGFAVVADEVRALASRTQQSTEEIQHIIEQLQQGSKQAVSVMQNSIDSSRYSVEQAEQAGTSLQEITSTVDTINAMNIQIASAANEQVSVSDEINRNIANINDAVTQTVDTCEQSENASQELRVLAQQLSQHMSHFKVNR